MTTTISIKQSNLLNTTISLPISPIQVGDILRITDSVNYIELPNGGGYEVFVFEKANGECEFVQLSLSQLLRCKGAVGFALRKSIANHDIRLGADLVEVLKERKGIYCAAIGAETRVSPNGECYKYSVYIFDWI